MFNRIASSFAVLALAVGALFAQSPVPGIDYPSPYPVPFVGYTVSTADPLLCVPGFSPQNYRSDLGTFKFCSSRNTWSIFNSSNTALAGTTLAASGAATLSSTLGVTGATTPTGGIVQSAVTVPSTTFTTPPIFLVADITDTTDVSGKIWYSQIFVPTNATLTGLCVLTGTATTDSIVMGLYSSAGVLLRSSALAGAALGTASAFSCQAFTATYAAVGPQTYFVAIQGNGTTAASFYAYGAAGPTGFITGAQTGGTFGTLGAITALATSFTASVGPVMTTY